MKTLTLICFALLIGAHPAFAAKKHHHYSTARAQAAPVAVYPAPTARAQAPFVSRYPAPVYPAPAPIDPLYASCSDMRITFPACPDH
jgi:hypothetical protein